MNLKFEDHIINQKYENYIQPLNQDVYSIIESRLNSIGRSLKGAQILDFGCNKAHLLTTSQGMIKPQNYTGIDVNFEALKMAKNLHQEANFLHYNRFNNTFNPRGFFDSKLPINEKLRFDFIIAYGVFTHFFYEDIETTINELTPYLKEGGIFLFSIWEDVEFDLYIKFLKDRFNLYLNLSTPNEFKKSITLINREKILIDIDQAAKQRFDWVESFFRPEYLKEKLSCKKLNGAYSKHSVYFIEV